MWRPAEPDSGNSEAEGTCRAWARCEHVPPAPGLWVRRGEQGWLLAAGKGLALRFCAFVHLRDHPVVSSRKGLL